MTTITVQPAPTTDPGDLIEVERLPVDWLDAAVIVGSVTAVTATAVTGWAAAGPVGLVAAGVTAALAVVTLDARRGH